MTPPSAGRRLTLRSAIVALLCTAQGAACSQSFEYAAPQSQTAFEAFVDSMRVANSLPAVAVAVVNHDSTIVHAAVGRRHVDRQTPVTLADYWQIGSLTKAFTASLVGVLVDRGQLAWTTTLAEAFPDLRASMDAQYRSVTLRQLLSHAAGVPPYTSMSDFNGLPEFTGTPMEQRRAFVGVLLQRPPAFPPGSRHQYSNAGFAVAAAVAEQTTGRAWEALMEQEFLKPLNIGVKFGWPAFADSAQPWGHQRGLKLTHPHDPHDRYQIGGLLAPAGALSLTIDGYGAFMRAHLNGLAGSDGVVKAGTVRMLHTPGPPEPPSDTLAGMALGWGIRNNQWGRLHGHAGSAGTFVCVVQLLSDQDLGIIVCTNVGGDSVLPQVQSVIEALRTRYASKR